MNFIGNDRARARLSRFSAQRPNSLLIRGPEGVGKFTSAVWYAKHLICGDAHEMCKSCDRIERMVHPDILALRLEGLSIGIGDVREAIRWGSDAPLEGAMKVVVIEDAHRLTPQAANALLKMTEEPPATTRFVLTAAGRVLPTLESRCTPIEFVAIPAAEIAEALGGGEKADLAASHASGSYSAAKALLEGGMLDRKADMLKFLTGGRPHQAFAILKADDQVDAWFRMFNIACREAATTLPGSRLASLRTAMRGAEDAAAWVTTTARFHICTALAEWAEG